MNGNYPQALLNSNQTHLENFLESLKGKWRSTLPPKKYLVLTWRVDMHQSLSVCERVGTEQFSGLTNDLQRDLALMGELDGKIMSTHALAASVVAYILRHKTRQDTTRHDKT